MIGEVWLINQHMVIFRRFWIGKRKRNRILCCYSTNHVQEIITKEIESYGTIKLTELEKIFWKIHIVYDY